jgi:hypothetical protein
VSPGATLTLTSDDLNLLLCALNLLAHHNRDHREAVFDLARRKNLPLFTDQVEPAELDR